jgi:Phytanoyl-CoA dioxygenase (PhyH)
MAGVKLSDEQIEAFWRDGFLVVPDAVTPEQLAALQADFASWVDESRDHDSPYGDTLDGRPRFDVQPGHCAEQPALRRVQAPADVSGAYRDVLLNSAVVDAVADLIGPNVKVHHDKINSKLPGSATEVKWHQDFPFTPHSNDSLVTALLMVDEVTDDNGPLEVGAGSHNGEIFGLWHDDVFTGAMDSASEAEFQKTSQRCLGPAGSVCLMHTRLAHGSTPNYSTLPRTLYICVYAAGDAVALSRNPVPNIHDGTFVRGTDPGHIRSMPFDVARPEYPKAVSFFAQQSVDERSTT